MREGSIREIPRRDVVVGDVVYIEGGETVPGGRRARRGRLAEDQRIDPHRRTRSRQDRRPGALRPRSNLSLECRHARDDRRRRIRRPGRNGRRRRHRGRARHRAIDRPERGADAARPAADPALETHRPRRNPPLRADLLRHARQGRLRRRAARSGLALDLAAGAEHLHGLGGHHRHGRTRRAPHVDHPLAGHVHARGCSRPTTSCARCTPARPWAP